MDAGLCVSSPYAAAERTVFNERLGLWAFWLCDWGLVLWNVLNFPPTSFFLRLP